MALASEQVSVPSSAAVNLLADFVNAASISDQCPVSIRNMAAAGTGVIWVGGKNVTPSNGFPLYGLESFPFQLLTSDTPWAVAGSGTGTMAVIVGRQ